MPDLATRTLETLGLLYTTAFSAERWEPVLDAVAALAGGNGALLFTNDERNPELRIAAMSTRYKRMHADEYLSTLVTADELRWLEILDELPPRTITTDRDIWPDRGAYDAMPSVRFLRELNLYHRVAVRPCVHGGWKDALAILYDKQHPGVRPAESRRLSLLVPHVARAIETHRPFALLRRRFQSVLTALDRLGIGVVILSDQAQIVVSNAEAERMLAADDGVRRGPKSNFVITAESTDARFAIAVERAAQAARLERSDRGGVVVHVPRRSGLEHYVVDVVPFRDDGDEMGAPFCGVLLIVIDPDHRDMISVDGLAKSYGLSEAETIVCRMIAQGFSLREIAEVRGVQIDTVKTQSRNIYAKSHTRNRRELVRRALSIVPPLVGGSGSRIN